MNGWLIVGIWLAAQLPLGMLIGHALRRGSSTLVPSR